MYFMIIGIQNKRVKEHNKLIESLSNGTEVVVSNGCCDDHKNEG